MKAHLLALTLAVSGMCAAHQDPPRHFRISLQLIEVPHPVLTELTSGEKKGGSAMHDAAFAYAKEGKAKLLETCMVVCRSGQRAEVESIREEIYPSVYYSMGGGYITVPPMVHPGLRNITAFETRNTGVNFLVEPTFAASEGIIDLRFTADVITPIRLETWMEHKDQWGDASTRMPVFERWSVKTALTLAPGKFELVSVISPKPALPAPAVPNKILVFVRADVLPESR